MFISCPGSCSYSSAAAAAAGISPPIILILNSILLLLHHLLSTFSWQIQINSTVVNIWCSEIYAFSLLNFAEMVLFEKLNNW